MKLSCKTLFGSGSFNMSGSEIRNDLLISARPFICHPLRKKSADTSVQKLLYSLGAEFLLAFNSLILPLNCFTLIFMQGILYVMQFIYDKLFCSQSVGEEAHHSREKDSVRPKGKGGSTAVESSVLHKTSFHISR